MCQCPFQPFDTTSTSSTSRESEYCEHFFYDEGKLYRFSRDQGLFDIKNDQDITSITLHHVFVVWWWSIERNSENMVLSKKKEAVVNKLADV